jgi:hypothetical protein
MKPALENTIFDGLKLWRLSSGRSGGRSGGLSGVEAFVLGLLARAVCTVCTFPATRGLRIQQGRRREERREKTAEELEEELEEVEEESLVSVLLSLVRNDGFGGLFVGIGPDIGRGVLSSAIRYSIKEKIQQWMKFLKGHNF